MLQNFVVYTCTYWNDSNFEKGGDNETIVDHIHTVTYIALSWHMDGATYDPFEAYVIPISDNFCKEYPQNLYDQYAKFGVRLPHFIGELYYKLVVLSTQLEGHPPLQASIRNHAPNTTTKNRTTPCPSISN
jgi:hypothetical protein